MLSKHRIGYAAVILGSLVCSHSQASDVENLCKTPESRGLKQVFNRIFNGEELLPSTIRCQEIASVNRREIALDQDYSNTGMQDVEYRSQRGASIGQSLQEIEIGSSGLDEMYQKLSNPSDERPLETIKGYKTINE